MTNETDKPGIPEWMPHEGDVMPEEENKSSTDETQIEVKQPDYFPDCGCELTDEQPDAKRYIYNVFPGVRRKMCERCIAALKEG